MYSKLKFCSELLALVSGKANYSEIASWASERRLTENHDNAVENELDKLSLIDEPGFELSRKEMLEICSKFLNQCIDEAGD